MQLKSEKSICIIGAGQAGICAARRCYEAGFKDITIFEQSNMIGGLWNYTDKLDVHSSIYDKLLTNSPRVCMGFRDFPVPDYDNTGKSFFPREEFLQYLDDFAEPVKKFIELEHKIIKVSRDQWKPNEWKVLVKGPQPYLLTRYFDIVFVCNGIFRVPNLPSYAEKYKGSWLHSHNYRKAEIYEGKTVAIIGAGLTGIDICDQVSKYADKVYLLYKEIDVLPYEFPQNVIKLTQPIDAKNTNLYLANGDKLTGLDTVIYCTGYKFDFPFLDPNVIKVKENGKLVSPLFEHVAHRDYLDSFFIIGLPCLGIATHIIEHQVSFAISLINGETTGFTKEDVDTWEEKRIKELFENNESLRHFHYFHHPLSFSQWEYYKKLSDYTNIPNYCPQVYEKIWFHLLGNIQKTPCEYRKYQYEILNDEEFEAEQVE